MGCGSDPEDGSSIPHTVEGWQMNEQERFWEGGFGDEYTLRNQVDWGARVPFWRSILDVTQARSVIEVGCNAGWNLSAIAAIDTTVIAGGIDVNESAVTQARARGLFATVGKAAQLRHTYPLGADLVFTSGVLIHIAPRELHHVMQSIVASSKRWVLAVEYDAETEEAVEYRGSADRLWKRPFGNLYRELGLLLIAESEAEGFDGCRAWLLRKP